MKRDIAFPFDEPELATYQPPAPIWNGAPLPAAKKDDLLLTEILEKMPERHPNEAEILNHFSGEQTGLLKQASDGHLLLKVDAKIITTLLPHLGPKATRPPYFHHIDRIGAHITVMSAHEAKKVKEKGQKFSYRVTGCIAAHPHDWPGVRKVWILTIESKELEHLREKYHLSSTPSSRTFFLTIAIEKSVVSKKPKMHFRVSPTATIA